MKIKEIPQNALFNIEEKEILIREINSEAQ